MKVKALVLSSVAIFALVSAVFVAEVGASPRLHVSRQVFLMASKVAVCEEGGWGKIHDAHGPTYYGHLGWLDATWQRFRRQGFPSRMDLATPTEESIAMARFAGVYGWPDQSSCTGGY